MFSLTDFLMLAVVWFIASFLFTLFLLRLVAWYGRRMETVVGMAPHTSRCVRCSGVGSLVNPTIPGMPVVPCPRCGGTGAA